MNWRWKARIQNAVAALPFGSNPVYFAIQRTAGGLRPGRISPVEWFKAGVRMVEWAESAGRGVEGKCFLEVGTGRMVNVPTALWLCGAARTVTVDLNPYLSDKLVAESNQYLRQNKDEVLKLFGARAERAEFQKRFDQLMSFKGGLAEFLKLTGVEYHSPADAARLRLPDGSIDFHISNTVLEHIPPKIISDILREARRVLAPGGLLIHFIDPSDHFSHDDGSITAVNFLRFSQREWDRWAGNQFMYHNRLRSREHLELFERAGVNVLKQEKTIDDGALGALRNGFQLDDNFKPIPPEELATTTLDVMGTFTRGVEAEARAEAMAS